MKAFVLVLILFLFCVSCGKKMDPIPASNRVVSEVMK